MTKDELHVFAAAGVAQKIATMEQELATYHKEWPELFLSPTAPQLLKAPTKNGSNGHWPPIAAVARVRGYQRIHDYLRTQPDHTASPSVISKALTMPESSVLSSFRNHPELFTKLGYGRYQLTKEVPTAKVTTQAAAPTPTTRVWSKASRRKASLAMKRRHASGEMARARAKAAKARGN